MDDNVSLVFVFQSILVFLVGCVAQDTFVDLETPDPSCPCLSDVHDFLRANAPDLFLWSVQPGQCEGLADLTGHCLPSDYAQGRCAAWDDASAVGDPLLVSSACQVPSQGNATVPAWCSAQFCYVDRNLCRTRTSGPSTYTYRGQALPSSAGLGYSYQTCGFHDRYKTWSDVQQFTKNLVIRVTAPEVANPTINFQRGFGHSEWEGPVWTMVQELAKENNFTLVKQPLTRQSLELAPYQDTWWACLHMVSINATDLCVADFWVSGERRAYLAPHGTFSAPFDAAEFLFVTSASTKKDSNSWGLSNPLRPFSTNLWMTMAAAMLLSAVSYYLAETAAARVRSSTAHTAQEPPSKAAQLYPNPPSVYENHLVEIDWGTFEEGAGTDEIDMDREMVEELPMPADPMVYNRALTSPSFDESAQSSPVRRAETTPSLRFEPGKHSRKRMLQSALAVALQAKLLRLATVGSIGGGSIASKAQVYEEDMHPDPGGSSLMEALYTSLMSFVDRGVHAPRSHGGRLVAFMFGIFLLISINYWSSGITTDLIVVTTTNSEGSQTLRAAASRRELVCSQGYLATQLKAKAQEPSWLQRWDKNQVANIIVTQPSISKSLEAMDRGECDHILSDLDQFSYQLATTGGDHCDKGAVGTTVIEPFQIAMPVRDELEAIMSLMITEYASRYHEIRKRALETLSPVCSTRLANRAGQAADDEVAQYSVADMSSELILLVASAGIGVLLSIYAPGVPEAAK
mmetsp:Transcript_23525/g.44854  ORF Transcript_23525/g.44854 Transcript_23525/m.44854 type:complete len:743 (-) Transcript_23525:466-2694(-)